LIAVAVEADAGDVEVAVGVEPDHRIAGRVESQQR
jgi:hypothetical protein